MARDGGGFSNEKLLLSSAGFLGAGALGDKIRRIYAIVKTAG